MKTITILAAILAVNANAQIKLLSQQKASSVYLDASTSKQLSAGEAVISLAKGGRVLKCTEVEANETKSGIGLKAKK
jgi:hypothetical protein